MMRRVVMVALVVCLLSQAAVAKEASNPWADAGYGVASVVANLFYMPAKMVYAVVGTVTGSLAYVCTVGDAEAANRVWSPSLGGTYVIHPAMVRGEEPILFNGPSYSND